MMFHGWTPDQIISLAKSIAEILGTILLAIYALRNSHNSIPKSVAELLLALLKDKSVDTTTTQPVGTTVTKEQTITATANEAETVSDDAVVSTTSK